MKVSLPPLNTYSFKARLQPVLFVALPGMLTTLAWWPEAATWWSAVSGMVLASGVPALLSQLGRDWGKRKQSSLWASWGGPPTTRLLRHRDARNAATLARYHQRLQQLIPGTTLPTDDEERQNAAAADLIYEACVDYLRGKTRDEKRFALVATENANYGFRRNLWGLKPIGITVSVLALVASGVLLVTQPALRSASPALVAGISNVLILLLWIVKISPDWVRVPAEAYAEALLSSIDQL